MKKLSEEKKKNSQNNREIKKKYQSPTLLDYGAVSELTSGGSTGAGEKGFNPTLKKKA